jgi:thymidylate kinase
LTGLIVVFEGLPGCGKSTIAREAIKRLANTVLMPEVSEMVASRGFEVADRASIGTETWFLTQYYTRGAEAKMLKNEGKHVIMDRNYASSLAFGFANFVASNNPSLFMHFPSYIVNKAVGTLVKPDAYIYFKIPVEESVRRQNSREELKEELRTESVSVLSNCIKFYEAFFSILEPEVSLYEIDATRSKGEVLEKVMEILESLMENRLSTA